MLWVSLWVILFLFVNLFSLSYFWGLVGQRRSWPRGKPLSRTPGQPGFESHPLQLGSSPSHTPLGVEKFPVFKKKESIRVIR